MSQLLVVLTELRYEQDLAMLLSREVHWQGDGSRKFRGQAAQREMSWRRDRTMEGAGALTTLSEGGLLL